MLIMCFCSIFVFDSLVNHNHSFKHQEAKPGKEQIFVICWCGELNQEGCLQLVVKAGSCSYVE